MHPRERHDCGLVQTRREVQLDSFFSGWRCSGGMEYPTGSCNCFFTWKNLWELPYARREAHPSEAVEWTVSAVGNARYALASASHRSAPIHISGLTLEITVFRTAGVHTQPKRKKCGKEQHFKGSKGGSSQRRWRRCHACISSTAAGLYALRGRLSLQKVVDSTPWGGDDSFGPCPAPLTPVISEDGILPQRSRCFGNPRELGAPPFTPAPIEVERPPPCGPNTQRRRHNLQTRNPFSRGASLPGVQAGCAADQRGRPWGDPVGPSDHAKSGRPARTPRLACSGGAPRTQLLDGRRGARCAVWPSALRSICVSRFGASFPPLSGVEEGPTRSVLDGRAGAHKRRRARWWAGQMAVEPPGFTA